MPALSIIMPTITGREESLARAVASYEETTQDVDFEIIVVKDEPSWPTACNVGYARSTGDVVHFSADDLEALPGWWVEPLEFLEAIDELPAPKVMNFSADGTFDNEDDGANYDLTHFTRIPIMRRDQWERIGIWPEIVYYADVWVSEKARTIGIGTRLLHSYIFVHHWSQIGRVDSEANMEEAGAQFNHLLAQMGVLGS